MIIKPKINLKQATNTKFRHPYYAMKFKIQWKMTCHSEYSDGIMECITDIE